METSTKLARCSGCWDWMRAISKSYALKFYLLIEVEGMLGFGVGWLMRVGWLQVSWDSVR